MLNADALLLSYPVPWPDEGLFADASIGLLRHGTLATHLYQDYLLNQGKESSEWPPTSTR